jgi:hypothetical protein
MHVGFFKRLTIPLIIVFGLGLAAFAQDFVPLSLSDKFSELMTTWLRIMGGFALFLGAYSLLHMHVARIRRKMAGWGYSVFVFIGAAAMIILGFYNSGAGPLGNVPKGCIDWFKWGYIYIQVPAAATIFSILAFFMASAAFRTFRARNVAAALLLTSAVIVMFGRVPVSDVVGRWLFGNDNVFPTASDVIMGYFNLAAQRGVLLGVSLGVISQSVRILFGIERSYLGGE